MSPVRTCGDGRRTRRSATTGAGSGDACLRSRQGHGRAARPREVQGHDQRAHRVRRSAAGHGTQSEGGRLDRGAAEELRLHEHRADHLHVSFTGGVGSCQRRSRPRRRPASRWRGRSRRQPAGSWTAARRSGRRHPVRHARPHRGLQPGRRGGGASRSPPARAQCGADDARRAAGSLLHQDRRHEARRDVHRRRPHGRPRLGRGGQRRRIGHGDRDGARAHLQRAGRRRPSDRFASSSGTTRKAASTAHGRTSTSGRIGRARKIRRARAGIPSRSGWA